MMSMYKQLDKKSLGVAIGAFIEQLETKDIATVGQALSMMFGVPMPVAASVVITILTSVGDNDEKISAVINDLESELDYKFPEAA